MDSYKTIPDTKGDVPASQSGMEMIVPAQTKMLVRFWGVRGSIASPGPETLRYGANTSCVEIRCGDRLLVCDAGTGLRPFGQALVNEGQPVEADLLVTHTHFDHIGGFPFFQPCYLAANRIRVWGAHHRGESNIGSVFRSIMTPPLFPDVTDAMAAKIAFEDFKCGDDLTLQKGLSVKTRALNHPGGATGYRIEWEGKAVAYITDTEHRTGALDRNVLTLADHVDVMIYDAHYTSEDYPAHVGFGHSTWQEAVKLAERAGAKTLVLFHHDPARTDAMLDEIGSAAARARSGTIVASEGLLLTI